MSQKGKLNTPEEKVEIIKKYPARGNKLSSGSPEYQELGQRRFIDGVHGIRQNRQLDFYHIGKIVSIRQN